LDAPVDAPARALVAAVRIVAGDPDSVVGNRDALLFGVGALSPLEVEDVIRDVDPLSSDILRVVELLVNSAWLISELSTSRPGSCHGPVALCGMEQELLHLLASVEGLDVGATVFTDPVDARCS
jgi:hypothetical protein